MHRGSETALLFLILFPLFNLFFCAHSEKERVKLERIKAEDVSTMPSQTVPEFVFGPGDEIEISVWRHEDLNMKIKISPDGAISYPLIGRMNIAGMTYPQLMELLREKISQYYIDPQVSINICKVSSMKVYVLGEVNNPCVLQIESEMDVLEALTRAGGITDDSKTKNILLIRGGIEKPTLILIDIRKLLEKGDISQNIALQKGDIIYVPEISIAKAERFFKRISALISPFVSGTAAYRNMRLGGIVIDEGGQ